MPWRAIQYVSSGATLAAFILAVVLTAYRRQLKSRERLIASVPENERAPLVQSTLESFHVDTSRLTKQQAYDLAIHQIRARSRRYVINASVLSLLGVLTFIIFLVNGRRQRNDSAYVSPVVNGFRGYGSGSQEIEIADGRVPITLTSEPTEVINGEWDYNIDFDLFNKGNADPKINALYVDVLSVQDLEPILRYMEFLSVGEPRKFTCRFEKHMGRYPCRFGDVDQYLFLRAGEHESINLAINTKDEGKYSLAVIAELSTVDGMKTERIGEVHNVRILDHSRTSNLPDE